jgi:hypothetical protein
MCKPYLTAISSALLVLSVHSAYADENLIYLKCKADPEYLGKPEIVVDKAKKTIAVVPIKEGLPLTEDETNLEGKIVFQDQVMFQISVNKFTLRYLIKSALEPRFSAGQCVIERRQL